MKKNGESSLVCSSQNLKNKGVFIWVTQCNLQLFLEFLKFNRKIKVNTNEDNVHEERAVLFKKLKQIH